MAGAPKLRTCLWFQTGGHEAAEVYVDLLPDSRIDAVMPGDNPDDPLLVELTLGGAPFQFLTAGEHYKLTPAASISVTTEDQAETDRLWAALLDGGGAEMACGWLTDRFGVSWQIIPRLVAEAIGGSDRERARRAHTAILQMVKIDIATVEAALEEKQS